MSETDERSIADRGTLDRGLALARQMGGQLISLYSTVQLIEQARRLDAEVDQSLRLDTHQVNSLRQALRNLIAMYHELERRITDAPLDESGLPQLDGIRWSPGSPNAGQALDILPFGKLDLWTRLLNNLPQSRPERRRRRRPGRRSEPVVPVINPDLPSVDGAQVAEDLSGTPEDFSLTNGVLTTVRGILAGVGLVGQVSGVAALATAGFFAALTNILVGFFAYVLSLNQINSTSMLMLERATARAAFMLALGVVGQWRARGYSSVVGPGDFRRNTQHQQANRILQQWAHTAQLVGTPQERQDLLRRQSIQVHRELAARMNQIRTEVRAIIVQVSHEKCLEADPNMSLERIEQITRSALREHFEANVLLAAEEFGRQGARRLSK